MSTKILAVVYKAKKNYLRHPQALALSEMFQKRMKGIKKH